MIVKFIKHFYVNLCVCRDAYMSVILCVLSNISIARSNFCVSALDFCVSHLDSLSLFNDIPTITHDGVRVIVGTETVTVVDKRDREKKREKKKRERRDKEI